VGSHDRNSSSWSRGIDTDAFSDTGLQVTHEHVVRAVRVVRNEVARVGIKRHVAAVGTEHRAVAVVVRLRTVHAHARPDHLSCRHVEHVDVQVPVRVGGNQAFVTYRRQRGARSH
jgi:hypothetical protein